MKVFCTAVLILFPIVQTVPAQSRDAGPESSSSGGAYLGVFTSQISEPLQVQLNRLVKPGTGLLIERTVRNSPAARAGLQPFDLLLAVDGKSLSSAEQLREILGSFKPNREITLSLIRSAEPLEVSVKLAERRTGRTPRSAAGITQQSNLADLPGASNRSIEISSRDGNRYRILVSFETSEGKEERRELEGTVTELRQQAGRLPRLVGDDVRRLLESLSPPANQSQALRLRMQPFQNGPNRLLRISFRHPGQSGAVQMVELQHDFGESGQISADAVLALPALQRQLQRLPPSVRSQIERTLQKSTIPRIQVRTLEAQ